MNRLIGLLLVVVAVNCNRPESESGEGPTMRPESGMVPNPSPPQIQDSAPAPSPSGPVTLRTDGSRYAPGAPVMLTLTNTSETRYTFNPCTRIIEREANGSWQAVEEPGRMCTMIAWLLEPNATRTAGTEFPADIEPGQYRVVILLAPEDKNAGESTRAVSAAVTIGS